MKTRDIDIRTVLHRDLYNLFERDPSTRIVDELSLCQGDARVDIAVINGMMHGYEIKSERDTLERLPNQVEIYSKVLDNVTIVTASRHCLEIEEYIPEWWGIVQAKVVDEDVVSLFEVRSPHQNPTIDPYSLVQLLWRKEALEILSIYNLEKGFLSKGRRAIWKKLADSIPLENLKDDVRGKIKERKNWRVEKQSK